MRGILLRLGAALSLFVALIGWAVSSPVGSSPDDDYHLSSIWCSQFSPLYPCSTVAGDQGGMSYLAPTLAVEAHICYAFQPTQTADCVAEDSGTLRLTDRLNQEQGLYPSGYYTAMSTLAGDDLTESVTRMRLLNAGIASALLLVFLLIGRPLVVRTGLLALPVIMVPLGMFLFASTNPSSWTIVGCSFYFLFALSALLADQRSQWRWLSVSFAGLSALLALVSRVDAAAFVAVITAAVFLLIGWRQSRAQWSIAALLLVIGAIGAALFLIQGSGSAGSSERIGDSKYIGGLLATNIAEIPGYLAGAVGGAPLGWADTPMPGLVSTTGLLAFGAVAFWGLAQMDRRKAGASVFLVIAAFGIPVVFAQQQRIEVLDFVQARYLLPLLAVLLIALAWTPVSFADRIFPKVTHWVVATLLSVAGALSLWVNFRRYSVGSGEPLWGRGIEQAWSGLVPELSVPVIYVGMLSTVVFVVLMTVTYRHLAQQSAAGERLDRRESDDREATTIG